VWRERPRAFNCSRDPSLPPLADRVASADRKGLAVDDTTWDFCPGLVPEVWPGTTEVWNNSVKNIRIFRGTNNKDSWSDLRTFLAHNSAKALIGTPITCNQLADDAEWAQTLNALHVLGPQHVMGIAVGNELELLQTHANNCSGHLWDYFFSNFRRRLDDLNSLDGGVFANVTITSVFGADIQKCGDPLCSPPAMTIRPELGDVLTRIYSMLPSSRFAISVNLYPYFQPYPPLLPSGEPVFPCETWLRLATCLDSEGCVLRQTLMSFRYSLTKLLGRTGSSARLIVGEAGWSSPQAAALDGASSVCPHWSAQDTLKAAYRNFLSWNLSIGHGFDDAEAAFWFSIRDSNNFGMQEHFGLCGAIGSGMSPCANRTSKV